ncbi:MFS transporter [Sphaerisporangium krabiense]|uniref:MFS family permease n=1 Tax=Sphaerisporangium krabiense TaxID=763782 RepID=A0A7W9DRV9_9ACTN|nr:MFS transporter [Sphaerisporangium krabiense]MBB5628883.1 MFS family permease [Sphaerisporangium krabiense]GII60276.1 MFS transporter [Sphaerisporangium krabiense]
MIHGADVRVRATVALSAGTALMNAAMATAGVTATFAAAENLGTAWSGVPVTASIAGTGLGALLLTRLMERRGRRPGLALGYLAAIAGAALAVAAVAAHQVVLLCAGTLLLGLGNAAAQLSRYAAADFHAPDRRGFAIGIVVWGATVGAVGGPLLLQPAADAAAALGAPPLTGPLLSTLLASAGAAIVVRALPRSTTATGAPQAATGTGAAQAPDAPAGRARGLAGNRVAWPTVATMVTGQVIMVALMTAAPLDMHMHGQGLGAVGVALSAHTFGMFALSPLTGRLVDRLGTRPVMAAGLVTLLAAAFLAATGDAHPLSRTAGLFLLGYGWNLCFIGGSGRLARDLPAADRTRLEGEVDAVIWVVAAVAGQSATVILSTGGYGVLAAASAALLVVPAVLLLRAGPAPVRTARDYAGEGDRDTASGTTGRTRRPRSRPWRGGAGG